MRRFLLSFLLTVGVVIGVSQTTRAQPFNTQIQIAINQLVTGVVPFTALRNAASAYMNWGTTQGTNGYGFRDAAGSMQVKSSGGTWQTINPSGSGDPNASYWTRVPEALLTNETALSLLATGVVLNTTTTGVPTIYAGATCTNQFIRALSVSAAATCQTVALLTDTSGTLTVARGGTGLTTGTSGGVLAFTAAGVLASSAALTANRLVIGGGAGAVPTVLGSLGTTTTLLHGNAGGAPTFGAVTLTTEVTGILPAANGGTASAFFSVTGPTMARTFAFPDASTTILTTNTAITAAQGGTGQTTYTIGDLLQATGATTLSKLIATSTGNALISGGVATASSWGKIGLTTHITGTLPVANGGTGLAAYTTGDLLYASAATTIASRAAVALGQVLISQGAGVAPIYSANPRISTLLLGADLALSSAAPTISSGFGTGPSVTAGTSAAFRVNVGTGGTATAGVLALPTATTGWNCSVENITGTTANVGDQRTVQLSSTTATATIENQTISTGAALAWTASDILAVSCTAF